MCQNAQSFFNVLVVWAVIAGGTYSQSAQGFSLCQLFLRLVNAEHRRFVNMKRERAKRLYSPEEAKLLSKSESHISSFSNEITPIKKAVAKLGADQKKLNVEDSNFENYEKFIVPNSMELLIKQTGKKGGGDVALRVGHTLYFFSSRIGLEKESFRYYLKVSKGDSIKGFLLQVSPREMERTRLFLESRLAGNHFSFDIWFNNCSHMACGALAAAGLKTPSRLKATRPKNLPKFFENDQDRTVATVQHLARPKADEE